MVTASKIWELLSGVFDPEVPVLTILDLGIVRDVAVNEDTITIKITPTYTGCPAMQRIEQDIYEVMNENNVANVHVELVLSPAWTTGGKEKVTRVWNRTAC